MIDIEKLIKKAKDNRTLTLSNKMLKALEQLQETIKAKDKEIKNLHAVINARDSEDKELFEGTHEALEGLTIRGEK